MLIENLFFILFVIIVRSCFYFFLFSKKYSYFFYFFIFYKFKKGNYLENTISDSIQVIIVASALTSFDIISGRI